MSDELRSAELQALLGEKDFLRLTEAFGGTRLYIPKSGDVSDLAKQIGADAAGQLGLRRAGEFIRVPLAREWRARQYRAAGLSNGEIARRLGMTETGVDKLFGRMPNKPVKGSRDPRQADLFSST